MELAGGMVADAEGAAAFYAGPQGRVVAGLLRARLARAWPHATGLSVLGIGYSGPYLAPWRETAARCAAVTLEQMGAVHWPDPTTGLRGLSASVQEDCLPFPDLSFDRVLMVHGLESAENARRLLREVWRVLRDDGSLIVVAPNRRGLWALVEQTPFGQGQPYSPGQIGRLLTGSMFRVTRRDTALYLPPVRLGLVLKGARSWERIGRAVVPHLAGVTITEAAKDAYAIMPVGTRARRRVVFAGAQG